jgi:hypothetical protein
MDIMDAAYNLVHDYPGGAGSLAPRLGKSPTTLSHEVTETGTAKLGWRTVVKASVLAQNRVCLNAFAFQMQCSVLPWPESIANDEGTLMGVSTTVDSVAAYVREVARSTHDDEVSDNELQAVNARLGELMAAVQNLQGIVSRMHRFGGQPPERDTQV